MARAAVGGVARRAERAPPSRRSAPAPAPAPGDAGDARLALARRTFEIFVARLDRRATVAGLHDSDADGVTAGVVWQRAFERAGFARPLRVVPDRERNPWTVANQARVLAVAPAALFVMDLGSRAEPVMAGVPTCFIDHHRPEGVPPDDTLISAYGWEPTPSTSLLAYELCLAIADVSDLDWVAAIGAISDLGERAPFELLAAAKRRHTAKYLREATTLINAARRAAHYDPEAAARALLSHPDPRALVQSASADVAQLRAARAEVAAAMEQAKRAPPVFAGSVALIRADSPCQIHPLLAQIWRTRLPGYVVIAANAGYLPGRVNFSVRAPQGVSAIDLLRSVPLAPGEGTYGHGHEQATGGSLPVERYNALLAGLGFPPKVFARAG